MSSFDLENISFVSLENSNENMFSLVKYFNLLDNSYNPPLSSYVNIDNYAKKLIENAHIEILEYNNEFVGLSAIYINDNSDKIAFCTSFGVLDKYKGLGFAQLLMDKILDVAKKEGMKMMKLEVKLTYLRAVKFYKKNGFVVSEDKTGNESTFYMYKTF